MPEMIDSIGHTIDIPERDLNEMRHRCQICHVPKQYAKLFDIHIDFMDCPYDCVNDIEHYRMKHPEFVSYK